MKKNIIYAILLSGVMLWSGCSDFLERFPDTAVPEEEAMTDLVSAKEVVIGIYSSFKNPALYSGTMVLAQEIQSDLVYAVKGYTNAYGEIYRWEIKAADPRVEDVFGGLYQIISRCNFFMDHADAVRSTLKTEEERNEFKKVEGDAYFARAIAYSDLIRIYCEAYDPATAATQRGVSLYKHYREPGKDVSIVPRSSLKESYEFVIADLNAAEERASRIGSNTQFFTKGAVAALKARVYLYMKDWDNAVKYATEVIDAKLTTTGSRIYALANAFTLVEQDPASGNYMTAYQKMWKYDSSDEIILRVQYSVTDLGASLGRVFLNENAGTYYPDYVPAKWLLDAYEGEDFRYPAFFYEIKTGHSHGLTWPVVIKYLGNANLNAGSAKAYVNMPKLLRLGETYLIRAEAYANLNKEKEANADLTTLLRSRVRGYGLASYSGAELMKQIQLERAKELFMEGFRLSDLKRWNMGFDRKPQSGTLEGPTYNQLKVTKDNVSFTWPIPKHELDASMGIVEPNPSNNR